MYIANKIQIQIVNQQGRPNALNNIFFGFKIYTERRGGWHNYSFFKTDPKGFIELSKQQVIDHTGIKHNLADIDSDYPTEIEIYVWDSKLINDVVLAAKRISDINKDKDLLRKQLLKEGFAQEQIPAMIESFSKEHDKDKELYEFLKDVKNNDVQIYTKEVWDIWLDESPKYYEFIIESK